MAPSMHEAAAEVVATSANNRRPSYVAVRLRVELMEPVEAAQERYIVKTKDELIIIVDV